MHHHFDLYEIQVFRNLLSQINHTFRIKAIAYQILASIIPLSFLHIYQLYVFGRVWCFLNCLDLTYYLLSES